MPDQLTNPLANVGFGCASLGSRVSKAEGVAALERAYASGITWFDVAPSYGDGAAESILGEFAAARRQDLRLVTKLGLQAEKSGWKSLIRPLARRVVAQIPALRQAAKGARTVARMPLTPALINQSVDNSLRALRTDHLDALMLHDVAPEEVIDGDITAALSALRASGKVLAVGVASSPEAGQRAGERPDLYSLVQFANNPFEANAELAWLADWRAAGKTVVTHSALGAFGAMPTLAAAIERQPAIAKAMADAGYAGTPHVAAADFLTDYALATNANGTSLFSAMKPAHLQALVRRAALPRDRAELIALSKLIVAGVHA